MAEASPTMSSGNGAIVGSEEIHEGDTVIIQKYNYMRTHVLNTNKPLQLGRDKLSLGGIVGKQYGQSFEMVIDPQNKKIFQLQEADEIVDFESIFLLGGSGDDNRDLEDKEKKNQNLSREEIEEMRDTGVSGVNIVEKLIENSETYQNKTKFSQEKFLKKKAKKYHQYVIIRKPSIRLLLDIMYKADPMRVLNLRMDSLAQILNMTNIMSGGRYLVYETGAQGIVVAAMLERLGGSGELIHIYQTGQPQTAALNSMGLNKSPILKTINIQHLRSLEQGRDILQEHPSFRLKEEVSEDGTVKEPSTEPPTKKARNDESAEDKDDLPQSRNGTSNEDQSLSKKPLRMNLREKSVEAFQSLKSENVDGLVIVCKQHPGSLTSYLSKFVKPSRPFAIFCPYKEPLLEMYMELKESGIALMCVVSETWLRSHQVLPQRTHPTVMMSGGGGYLMTGTFIEK